MQMSRLMVWTTAFSDDELSETEYRLSADETPITLSGLPPENRDNSRDNIRTKHFIIAKINIFTQLSKRNQPECRCGPAAMLGRTFFCYFSRDSCKCWQKSGIFTTN